MMTSKWKYSLFLFGRGVLFVGTILFTGCIKEPFSERESDQITQLQDFEITTRAAGDDVNVRDGDDKVVSAMVYIYNAGTDFLCNKESLEVNPFGPNGEAIDIDGKLNKKWRVPVGNKDVYVIANPGSALKSQFTSTLTQTQLSAIISTTVISSISEGNGILMSAIKKNIPVSTELTTVIDTVPLTRRAARIEVFLRKAKELEFSIVTLSFIASRRVSRACPVFQQAGLQIPSSLSQLLMPLSPPTLVNCVQPVPDQWSANPRDYVDVVYFYTCELNASPNNMLTLDATIDGNEYNNIPIYLCSTSIGENQIGNDKDKPIAIEANKIYRVMATLSRQTIDVALEITDWNDVNVAGDIYGSELAFSRSKILMDFENLNKSFSTTLEVTASDNISFAGYEHNGTTTTDGSNLPAWLPLDNIKNLPNGTSKSVEVSLTYVLDNATDKFPVKLWFRAGNLKKNVTIVYDNGYLPNSLLSTGGWTTDQPAGGGLVIAKKGNRDPGGEADADWEREKMMWEKDRIPIPAIREGGTTHGELHGKGFQNTQAAYLFLNENNKEGVAVKSCMNMGTEWFIPSINELLTIYNLRNYLGDSYRYCPDTYGGAPYWSSTEGFYTNCMRYMAFYGGYMNTAEKQFTHVRTRCVRNLK